MDLFLIRLYILGCEGPCLKEGFQNVFIGEQTLDFDDFSLKERHQGATITLPGMPWVFYFHTYLFAGVRGGREGGLGGVWSGIWAWPSAASVSTGSAGPPDGRDTGSTKKLVDSLNAF